MQSALPVKVLATAAGMSVAVFRKVQEFNAMQSYTHLAQPIKGLPLPFRPPL